MNYYTEQKGDSFNMWKKKFKKKVIDKKTPSTLSLRVSELDNMKKKEDEFYVAGLPQWYFDPGTITFNRSTTDNHNLHIELANRVYGLFPNLRTVVFDDEVEGEEND